MSYIEEEEREDCPQKLHLTFLLSTASGSWVAQFLPRSVGWGLFESHVREEYTYLLILIILLYCLELTNLFTSHHQGLRLVLSSYVCVCHCQVVFLVYSSSIGFTSNGNGQAQAEKKIFDLIDGRMK